MQATSESRIPLTPPFPDLRAVSACGTGPLALGCTVGSASFGMLLDNELRRSAAHLIPLDRVLAQYAPETHDVRDLLRRLTATLLHRVWSETGTERVQLESIGELRSMEAVQERLGELTPQTDAQRWLQSSALQVGRDLAEVRRPLFEQRGSAIQWPFLALLLFWLAVVFAGFGLFAARNGTLIAALFLSALSVAASIYLILEMDRPYGGLVRLSSAPLRGALDQLGRP